MNFNIIKILPFVFLIRLYQWVLSPILKTNCRYLPTCSEYFVDCLKINGAISGSVLGVKRILRCHPIKVLGGRSGYDPAPISNFKRGKK